MRHFYLVKFCDMNILLLIAAVGAGYLLLNKKANAYRLRITPIGAKIQSGKLSIILGIYNPTNLKSTLTSVVGDVYYGGKPFGIVSYFGNLVVEPNSKTALPLLVKIDSTSILTTIINFIKTGVNPLRAGSSINFDATVTADNLTFDFSHDYKITT